MKFLKFSAALAVAGCFMINSIASATMKEEHELSGAKPTSAKVVVKSEAKSAPAKVVSKIENKVAKSKATFQNAKKLPEMKDSVQNGKEASKKESKLSKSKIAVQNEKELPKSKAVSQNEKKLPEMKGSVQKGKEVSKKESKLSKNKKEAFKIEAKLDTKKAQEKVKPVKKEFWNGMELPHNFKNISIFGDAVATKGQAVNLIKQTNSDVRLECSVEEIVNFYWGEAEREGVRPDIAFAQALVETGYFRFGGTVKPKQNNFCGLGTTGKKVKGAKFKTPEIGVRAHIQHLLAYSAKKKPSTKIVDPRYDLAHAIRGERGYVETWYGLNGTWAMGSHYCEKIMVTYQRMLTMEMSEAEKKELLARQKLAQEQEEARLKNDKKYRKQMEKEAKEREKARKAAEKEAKKRKKQEAEHKMHDRVDKVVREEKAKDK